MNYLRWTILLVLLLVAMVLGVKAFKRSSHLAENPVVYTPTYFQKRPNTPLGKLLASAEQQTEFTKIYDPAYVKIKYPNGDVPYERGVCADVIVRAFRAGDLDLQQALHEDMTAHFSEYPKLWGLKQPDPNIDHRRVANLMVYFKRQNKSLPITATASDYLPGDVVAWRFDDGRLHIGLVSDIKMPNSEQYYMIHNVGAGARIEDVLFYWKIVGHYRYF